MLEALSSTKRTKAEREREREREGRLWEKSRSCGRIPVRDASERKATPMAHPIFFKHPSLGSPVRKNFKRIPSAEGSGVTQGQLYYTHIHTGQAPVKVMRFEEKMLQCL